MTQMIFFGIALVLMTFAFGYLLGGIGPTKALKAKEAEIAELKQRILDAEIAELKRIIDER